MCCACVHACVCLRTHAPVRERAPFVRHSSAPPLAPRERATRHAPAPPAHARRPRQALKALQHLSVRGLPPAPGLQQHVAALGRLLDLSRPALAGALGALVAVLRRVSGPARARELGRGALGPSPRLRAEKASPQAARPRRAARKLAPSPRAARHASRPVQDGIACSQGDDGGGGGGGGDGWGGGGGAVCVDRLSEMALKGCGPAAGGGARAHATGRRAPAVPRCSGGARRRAGSPAHPIRPAPRRADHAGPPHPT
jgi:hypothetical protein